MAILVMEQHEQKAQRQKRDQMARMACREIIDRRLVKNQAALAGELKWGTSPFNQFLAEKRGMPDAPLSRLIKKYQGKLNSPLPENPLKDIEPDIEEDEYFPVPVYAARGSMGGGSFEMSWQVMSHISILKAYLRPKCSSLNNVGFILADGDSMIPTIPPGASVLIDTGKKDPVHGKVFCVMYDNQLYIKRLEVCRGTITAIVSDKDLSRIEIGPDDNFQIIGQVLLQQSEV